MNRVLLLTTAVGSVIAAQTAFAADIPRRPPPPRAPVVTAPPIFNWTGFYVGLQGGYGWGLSRWDIPGASTGDFGVNGWLLGGTVGVNYQIAQIVAGIEGDIGWSGIRGTVGCALGACETRNTWLGTVRGRLGFAMDRLLPYVTGGVAFGGVRATSTAFGSNEQTRVGWTLGAGLEYAFAPNWSVKGEYLYVDLGRFECGGACGGPPAPMTFNTHIVRAGVNVRF